MRLMFMVVAALLSVSAQAAELKDADAAVKLSESIVKKSSGGDVRGALEMARPYVVIPQSEFDAMLGQLELQLPLMTGRFGKNIGYELIRNDEVGGSLKQIIYIQKFERHAMVWRFIYYKNDKGWVLNTFKFFDDITAIL